jgi:hypothetical protein
MIAIGSRDSSVKLACWHRFKLPNSNRRIWRNWFSQGNDDCLAVADPVWSLEPATLRRQECAHLSGNLATESKTTRFRERGAPFRGLNQADPFSPTRDFKCSHLSQNSFHNSLGKNAISDLAYAKPR